MGFILGTLIAIVIIGGAIVFYLLKVKKIDADEAIVNYDRFERRDSTEFAKFDDIVSSGELHDKTAMGMMVVNKHTFIGGIDVKGYNYYSASAEERQRTIINAIAFFNTIEQPIQMRQTVESIDISRNINEEREYAVEIERRYLQKKSELEAALESLRENINNDLLYESIAMQAEKLAHTMQSLQWQMKEANEIIYYMEQTSGVHSMRKVNQILFSYIYNPDEDIESLSDGEIYLKAQKELFALAQVIGGSLEGTGCTWRPLTADDITELNRKHFHPLTGEHTRLDELLNSSYAAMYVTSDSLEEVERERRGDAAFEEEMKRIQKENEEKIRRAERAYAQGVAEAEAAAAAVEG